MTVLGLQVGCKEIKKIFTTTPSSGLKKCNSKKIPLAIFEVTKVKISESSTYYLFIRPMRPQKELGDLFNDYIFNAIY